MPQVRKTAFVVAVGALGLGGAFAIAAVPDGNGTIHACVTRQVGSQVPAVQVNLRVVDTAAGQACDPASEFALDFNQMGPQGPAGAQGPQGPAGADGTLTVTREAPKEERAGQVTLGALGTFDVLSVSLRQERGAAPGVVFRRPVDQLSPKFMTAALKATNFPKATVNVYKPGTTTVGSTIKMTNALISSFQTLSDGQRLLNEVTLQAQALKASGTLLPAIQYQATKKKGA